MPARLALLALLAWFSVPAAGTCGDAPAVAAPLSSGSAPAAVPEDTQTLDAFVRAHPGCLELGDGCVVCRVIDGEAQCSTPGIACQPGPLACLTLR